MAEEERRTEVLRSDPADETTVVVHRVVTAAGSAVREEPRRTGARPSGPARWAPSA